MNETTIVCTSRYGDGFEVTRTFKPKPILSQQDAAEYNKNRTRQQKWQRAYTHLHSFAEGKYFVTITCAERSIRTNPKRMIDYAASLLKAEGVSFVISLHLDPNKDGYHAHGMTDRPITVKNGLLSTGDEGYCEAIRDRERTIKYILRDNKKIPKGMHAVRSSRDFKVKKALKRIVVDGFVERDDFRKEYNQDAECVLLPDGRIIYKKDFSVPLFDMMRAALDYRKWLLGKKTEKINHTDFKKTAKRIQYTVFSPWIKKTIQHKARDNII